MGFVSQESRTLFRNIDALLYDHSTDDDGPAERVNGGGGESIRKAFPNTKYKRVSKNWEAILVVPKNVITYIYIYIYITKPTNYILMCRE